MAAKTQLEPARKIFGQIVHTTFQAALFGAAIFAAAGLSGCSKLREPPALEQTKTNTSSSLNECNICHGSNQNSAPPRDTHGNSDSSTVTVGAHQVHVKAKIGRAVVCQECHPVPAHPDAKGHQDGKVDIKFGPIASAKGVKATWNPETQTCTTYCHGATLGAGLVSPKWTRVDGAHTHCDSCHGFPPARPHPQSGDCFSCHSQTVGPNNQIAYPSIHIDGQVEVTGGACNSCHGNNDNFAPPTDLSGNTSTTARGVGAHQSHLKASIARSVACEECHVVPGNLSWPTHLNGTIDFSFTGVAAGTQWNGATCTSYCHGSTLAGGTATRPVWTVVNGSQKTCTSCHGYPPPKPHPQMSRCSLCHADTVSDNGRIIHTEKHIDGVVEVIGVGSCTACHGTEGKNAAPPVDTNGRSSTSEMTVGAHQAHLNAKLSTTVACSECHVVPQRLQSPGHLNGVADVSFGQLAGGNKATWNAQSGTCTTYCHGSTLHGGKASLPVWNVVDGSQKKCDSCHGYPPPPPHSPSTLCWGCHDVAAVDGSIADPEHHIDGKVKAVCNRCHGNAENSAPPHDMDGNTDTSLISVGAHQSHLKATLSAPVACNECHVVPKEINAPGHLGPRPAELKFGAVANSAGVTSNWNRGTVTCTTYCHGASLTGGALINPKWTTVDKSQIVCGSCHGTPPTTGKHPVVFEAHSWMAKDCTNCHYGMTDSEGSKVLKPALHINGVKNVQLPDGAWDPVAKTCTTSCHDGAKKW